MTSVDASTLAAGALDWLIGSARDTGVGLGWSAVPSDTELDPTLYSGGAGIVVALLEGYRHFGDDRFADAALRGARVLAVQTADWTHCSLYVGLTGMAVALRSVDILLGDRAAAEAADSALRQVRSRFDGERWSDRFDHLPIQVKQRRSLQNGHVVVADLA